MARVYNFSAGPSTLPESVLRMIRAIYIWGPVLCIVLTLAVLFAYKLEKLLPDILRELSAKEPAKE